MNLNIAELKHLVALLADVNDPLVAKIRDAAYPVKLINCTPHDIAVFDDLGNVIDIFPSAGDDATRVQDAREVETYIRDVPIFKCGDASHIANPLPEPKKNVFYIVSRVCTDFMSDRDDLLIPDQMVRDSSGSVIGCKGFLHV